MVQGSEMPLRASVSTIKIGATGLCPRWEKEAYETNEGEWGALRGKVAGAMNPKSSKKFLVPMFRGLF